jgi:hypothetical protein
MILWNRSINDNIRWCNRIKYVPKNPGTGEYRILSITQVITDGADCYPWTEFFCIFPRKTVTGKYIFWEKAYKRKVWMVWGTGFHMEPETQYATAFDLLVYEDPKTPKT